MVSKDKLEHAAELIEKLVKKGWNPDEFIDQLEGWDTLLDGLESSSESDPAELPIEEEMDFEDNRSSRQTNDEFDD